MADSGAPVAGYLLVTDKGVTLYSVPAVRSGKVNSRSLRVISDPTGTIAVGPDGRVVGWSLNAFIVGVPLVAVDGGGRLDMSHLGVVVSVVVCSMVGDNDTVPVLYDFWADANASSDRLDMPDDYPIPAVRDAVLAARAALGGPRPFPRRVPLKDSM